MCEREDGAISAFSCVRARLFDESVKTHIHIYAALAPDASENIPVISI